MSITMETGVGPMDIRALHERMGQVYHQPVRVYSFTNKRFTVNWRVPLHELRRPAGLACAVGRCDNK